VAQKIIKKAAKLPVSVIVLTKNEEKNLEGCLKSLAWARQVVVVDSQSTDRTVSIARRHGADVYVRPWPGFTAQRNFGLSKCRQPWVLSLDADERAAEDLKRAIAETLAQPEQLDGYRVPEINLFFGRWLRHGGVYPAPHLIFYRRHKGRYSPGSGDVHEGVQIPNPGLLNGHIIHLAYPTVDLALSKLNSYTDLEASGRLKRGIQASWYGLLWRPLERMLKNYLLKRGFLDGVPGLLYCFLNGYYTFIFELKMWEQRLKKDL